MPRPEQRAPAEALLDWAASGAMALTGRPDGPPLAAPGTAATAVGAALRRVAEAGAARTGVHPALPGLGLLSERAALARLGRRGPWSCGGAFRMWPTADGWWGLSLPRPEDIELVAALVSGPVGPDPWAAVADWARGTSTVEAVDRARLLGLACSAPQAPDRSRPGCRVRPGGRRARRTDRPLVVDLTSLWAGPLCAHLLGLTGAEVIKVESITRPDGARRGPAAFYDLLHATHASVALDFADPGDRGRLRTLVEGADLVLEASRPRALARLGLHADELVDAGVSWLSITARGRDQDAVGFGDDVAAGAGLWVRDGADLLPCGDALADPLAGVTAAAAAAEALLGDHAVLIDLSMHHVAAEVSTGSPAAHEVVRRGGDWLLVCAGGEAPIAVPPPRVPARPAAASGADNALLPALLRTLPERR